MKLLDDSSENGKSRDWKGKKKRSVLMSEHLHHADKKFAKRARRMSQCASVMMFNLTNEGLKLRRCYFCKGRLCPMCNWRRSLKIAFQNKKIVETANSRHKLKWLFLTLTVKNCEGSELKETIENMMKAWNRFMGYKRVKSAVVGYFRALEITKNRNERSKSFGTYHPHYHVLICVKPSYFSHGYIKQSDWVGYWKKAMRLDYDPIVHVERVKPKKNVDFEEIESEVVESVKEQKAIFEVSKYPVKDTDILPADHLTADGIETVYTLENAMSRKRLLGYGGLLKELHKELNLDDAEEGDLIHTGEDETANAIGEVMAYWHIGLKDYVIIKEIAYVNGKKVDKETGEILGRVNEED